MVSAAAAAPIVCRSPPAANARPLPSITSTLISSDASTSAPSCSSFLAIERSIELKAAGRFSVIVAIAPISAVALDHQHPDFIRRLDLGAELLQFFGDREVDRIEGRGPVQRDRCDRADLGRCPRSPAP